MGRRARRSGRRAASCIGTGGRPTPAAPLHAEVEALTDRLAEPAYRDLSDGALEDLLGALASCAADVVASGLLPFPNPMGLPRLAYADSGGRPAGRRPARHQPQLLAERA